MHAKSFNPICDWELGFYIKYTDTVDILEHADQHSTKLLMHMKYYKLRFYI